MPSIHTRVRPQTWEARQVKQDAQLDRIGNTVDTLGELARGMGDALDR